MAWLEDQSQSTSVSQDNIWLKFDQLKNVGEKSEIKMRIIDSEPTGVWQHWLDGRPYNCCRPDNDCPVCVARSQAKETNPDTYRDEFPMRHRYFFNVLVDENKAPVVKVFGLSTGLGKDLRAYSEKYGPLYEYDVTVRKTQVGRLPMNVEYSIFYEGKRDMTGEEMEAAYSKYDLSQFTQPASADALRNVARKEAPVQDESVRLMSEIRKHIPDDVDLAHFDVDASTPNDKLEALLRSLRGQ